MNKQRNGKGRCIEKYEELKGKELKGKELEGNI